MRKSEMDHKWDEAGIRQLLHKSAEEQEIPESLLPEQMEQWLKQQTRGENVKEAKEEISKEAGKEFGKQQTEGEGEKPMRKKHGKYVGWWCGTFAAAACVALVLFATGRNTDWEITEDVETVTKEAASEERTQEGTTYQKLYQSFDKVWKEQERYEAKEFSMGTDGAVDDAAAEESADMPAGSAADAGTDVAGDSIAQMEESTEADSGDYGKTNQQEEAVEEADIIKNDGRYLYQVIYQQNGYHYAVQIVDTKNGLKKAAEIGSFENIQDIYVWEDKLVVLEPGWAEEMEQEQAESEETDWKEVDSGGRFLEVIKDAAENVFRSEETACVDMVSGSAYCRIHIYDISDRNNPEECHTFTVKGSYMDSRISDGYLYFFTSCQTSRPKTEDDYKTYVPMLDGKPMEEEKISLPEETNADSYLVMASVDMEHPDEFADTCALVVSADKFYVSQKNIYVAETRYADYDKEGEHSDSTRLFRYSYKDGRMRKEAEGVVKGTLRDDMAMNEYQDHLRIVTTVESQNVETVIDDLSGDVIGYDTAEWETSNSLYVLDEELKVSGSIENLAPDERIYSARFMGDSGYFVTFRETDPLFSVDLSDPENPKILGELKISGFSEYLHFYADGLLLGIGMEAEEESGETQGMKLSMFDISNPSDVKEQSKLPLSEYDYSDALYNYKAVLIDTEKNLFGFSAEGYDDDYQRDYLLFTYENGEFKQIMKIDCSDDERYSWQLRGTYIGDRFFLLGENGLIEEYSLIDGSKTGELEL